MRVEVYCWGRGEDGQLGLGNKDDALSPTELKAEHFNGSGANGTALDFTLDDDEMTQASCGSGHSGLLTKNGKLFTWGRGDDGRLGHSDYNWRLVPTLVKSLKHCRIIYVNCGSYHMAAVSFDGSLYTWGGGMYGKLGHGNETGYAVPKRVETLKDVRQVACGSRHTVCLCEDNKIYSCGEKRSGVTGLGPSHRSGLQLSPEQIPNEYFTLSLSLVQSSEQTSSNTTSVTQSNSFGPNSQAETLANFGFKKLVACGFHSALLTNSGELFTWGEGRFGRLGRGDDDDDFFPKIIPREHFNRENVVDVSCGGFHSAAITESGKLYVWGGGEHGQLGMGNRDNCYSPTPLDSTLFLEGANFRTIERDLGLNESRMEIKAKEVVCGWSHTVCLVSFSKKEFPQGSTNLVFSWGNSDHGKLGHGKTDAETETKPIALTDLYGKNVIKLASYNEHTLALCDPQKVYEKPIVENTSSFKSDLLSLRRDSTFADITFIVEGRELFAHKCILSARSPHFRAMFEDSYHFREAESDKINLDDMRVVGMQTMDYNVFSALLDYIYTDDFARPSENEPSNSYNNMIVNLLLAADMYGLDHLKKICEGRIQAQLNVNNAAFLLKAAHDSGAENLRNYVIQYVVQNFEVVSRSEHFSVLDKELIVEILQRR